MRIKGGLEMAEKRGMIRWGLWMLLFLALCPRTNLWAGTYTIGDRAQWEKWTLPSGMSLAESRRGVVRVTDEGRIELVRIRKNLNAARNATQFIGIEDAIKVSSNVERAKHLIDGDPNTWWGPDQNAPLKDWSVEINLGRAVSATKIKLIFADSTTTNARPFEQFTVYVSDGAPIIGDVFEFTPIGWTTRTNTQRVVEYDLRPSGPRELVQVATVSGEEEVVEEYYRGPGIDSQVVQYVAIDFETKSERPGLAEVEVWALGDNIALGTIERGGAWTPGKGTAKPSVFDGKYVTRWEMLPVSDEDWEKEGVYFTWDLGALFWVDTIQILIGSYEFMRKRATRHPVDIEGYVLRVSDGSRTPEGKIDYETLADVDNRILGEYNFKHTFAPRLVRYLFMRHAHGTSGGGTLGGGAAILEIQIYGEGYPAGATLESDLIDVGEIVGDQRSKNITGITWEAEPPPGTWIEVRSTSGDSLIEEIHYYDQGGKEISEKRWKRTPKPKRGPKKVLRKPGGDWSPWSRIYRYSGEAFLSPSPRRYVKLQVRLRSEEPDAAPSLNSISLHFTDPLVQRILGDLSPRSAPADRDTTFSYLLQPTSTAKDPGFDKALIKVPFPVDEESVILRVDGDGVPPRSVETSGDSLMVQLPSRVKGKAVEIQFVTRVSENSTTFEAFIGSTLKPGVWQRVDPIEKGATTVYLLSLPASADLIGNLSLAPKTITPNDDGINDEAIIQFSVFKVDKRPKVTLYNLLGEAVKELTCQAKLGRTYTATWDGRDDAGERVPPGIYIFRIYIDADVGNGVVNRTVAVVF